tara:strand:+ start:221 stop:454 length:234 start_codon:yes stop_codon:yes gene_type:complete
MSEEKAPINKEQTEMLNEVENLSQMNSTTSVNPKYSTTNDASIFYKAVIKNLRSYSKGELFGRDEIIQQIRETYENL